MDRVRPIGWLEDEMLVEVAFDIVTKTWFVEGKDIEAPSLCELKKLLPPKAIIPGYAPNGCPPTHRPPTNVSTSKRILPHSVSIPNPAKQIKASEASRARNVKLSLTRSVIKRRSIGAAKRYARDELILNLWFKGKSVEDIEHALREQLGVIMPRPSMFRQVHMYRKAGDRRATRRGI